MMGERRASTAASAFSATLRKAKAAALARNRLVEVIFTTTEPSPATVVSATATASTSGQWLARVTPPTAAADYIDGYSARTGSRGVTITSSVDAIGFTPLGRPVLTGAGAGAPPALAETLIVRFDDTATARRFCTYVTTGGAVRTCDPRLPSGHGSACRPQLADDAC